MTITTPDNWNKMTNTQKLIWLNQKRDEIIKTVEEKCEVITEAPE